jgi:N-dimethylarginine dimethylaminohydrolase
MSARFLVCPPTQYALAYEAPGALRQWDRFIETLQCAGDVSLVTMDPHPNVPDLVFTANAALISGNLAIVSSFRHPNRRGEQGHYRAALTRAGLATTYLQQTYFEGSGDALFDRLRPLCYAGYGWRTERGAVLQLQEIIGCRVVPLMLTDERFAHLDNVLCPLGSGHVLAYMNAFSPHAQSLLRRNIEPGYLIEINAEDALARVCSAVEVDRALVMQSVSRSLRERLHGAGYRVFCTELDEFARAGGAAKNLTLRLDDGPAVMLQAATA